MALDRSMMYMMYIIGANVIALGVLYQRMLTLGYVEPLKDQLGTLLERFGVYSVPHEPCGFLNTTSYILTSSRVVFPDGVRPGAITVKAGKIVDVSTAVPSKTRLPVLDFKYAAISPGVIDIHAHINEPGREDWEGMDTGTSAAAAGGSTTLVDMPLNSDPCTITGKLVAQKVELAKAKARVNMAFWGGLVPANAHNPDQLWSVLEAGAVGFKSFLPPSGINDFPNVSRADVAAAVRYFQAQGVPYSVHAEIVTPLEADEEPGDKDPRAFATFLATRPVRYEKDAIALLLQVLLEEHAAPAPGFALHIAHLGDAGSLGALKAVKQKLPVSVETCAHYLVFQTEAIADGDTRFKCMPPLRDAHNRAGLIKGVVDGTISIIGSDHSPAPSSMKELESGNFLKAWGGISGLQYLLPATWTGLKDAGIDLSKLASLLSSAPAKLVGLSTKGTIAKGFDADFVVWDPEASADTSTAANHHRHKLTPYKDMGLKGKVLATFVRGHRVFDAERGVATAVCGGAVTRKWRRVALPSREQAAAPAA